MAIQIWPDINYRPNLLPDWFSVLHWTAYSHIPCFSS